MNFIHSLLHLLKHGRSTQEIVYTSLDDELFAHRERAYGSYELRKNQSWYLLTATGLVLSSVLCLVFVPIWMGWHLPVIEKQSSRIIACPFGQIPPPPPPGPLIIPQGQMITCRLVPRKEIERVEFRIPQPASEVFLGKEENPATPTKPLQPTGIENGNTLQDCVDCKEESHSQFPEIHEFILVDEEPRPLNLSEIKRKIQFPHAHQSGRIVFRVLVDEKGKTVDHQVIRASEEIFIEAVAQHLDELRWTPALQEGRPIPFWVNIPFAFRGLN